MKSEGAVFFIGVDSATLDLVRPLCEQGRLPTLQRLIRQGLCAPLASTLQPATAPAWSTILTGVDQGGHGVYDFFGRVPGTYRLAVTDSTHLQAPTVLELASATGKRVVSINVPYTFPPKPVNGTVIAGPFAPSVTRSLAYPPSAFEDLRRIVPGYFVLPEFDSHAPEPLADFAAKLGREIDQRETLAQHYLQRGNWDLFMLVFMAADEAQHTYWRFHEQGKGREDVPYAGVIHTVYEKVDAAIGRLIETAERSLGGRPLTVLIASDHGAGPFTAMVNLNALLIQKGFLRVRENPRGTVLAKLGAAARRLATGYRGAFPESLRRMMRKAVGHARFARAKAELESAMTLGPIDWARTQAYSYGVGGNIYLNVRGREPQGVVQVGSEYEAIWEAIASVLRGLTDPTTGDPLVKHVRRGPDIYSGNQVASSPDIVVEWSSYGYWGRGGAPSSLLPIVEPQSHFDLSPQPLSGSHRPEGLVIAWGSHVPGGGEPATPSVLDIAPTILSLLQVPLPETMRGRPLLPGFDAGPPPEGMPPGPQYPPDPMEPFAYSDADEQRIVEHLRSLGYL